ncbi:DMT family transporter, partial [Thioclava sp. BHET1]
ILWFYAMVHIPIAEVQALGYLTPVLVTIGAALFLGERIAARRIGAVIVALMGVAVVLRPGVQAVSTGDFAMLGTVVFFALSYITAKHLSGRASPGIVVAMLSVTVTIGLLPFAVAVWVTPTLAQVLWLFAVAGFATLAHLAMTKAFTLAPVTVTQPVTFLQLIWGTAMGALVFGEGIDGFVLAGGGIIIAAVGFITWREAVLNRRGVTPPAPATKV